jgi:hypothetical protein
MSKDFEERLKAALARREAKERASESELEDRRRSEGIQKEIVNRAIKIGIVGFCQALIAILGGLTIYSIQTAFGCIPPQRRCIVLFIQPGILLR